MTYIIKRDTPYHHKSYFSHGDLISSFPKRLKEYYFKIIKNDIGYLLILCAIYIYILYNIIERLRSIRILYLSIIYVRDYKLLYCRLLMTATRVTVMIV